MTNLEKAKEVIKANIEDAMCGIFHTLNTAGDIMTTIYEEDGLQIDICYYWSYFEVFGLTHDEFEVLTTYYDELRDEVERRNSEDEVSE